MQTFLPYDSFAKSAACLDNKRLGKQRVEAKQIHNIITNSHALKKTKTGKIAWSNHPAVLMWAGYEKALEAYYNEIVHEWVRRKFKNNMILFESSDSVIYPWWFGINEFHSSHRQTLLHKRIDYYSQFGWTEEPKYEYWWPTKNLQYQIDFGTELREVDEKIQTSLS